MSIIPARDLLVEKLLARVGADEAESRDTVDGVYRQAEAIDLIRYRQLQRRVDVAFLLVAADVEVPVISAAIRQSMNKPRVAVKIENHRPVTREQ